MKTIQNVINKIEELEWHVQDEGYYYLLSNFSPAGQDFNIQVDKTGEVNDFVENIYMVYENYDVSEETYLWLDNTGHGKNGAPFEMEDVLNDMKWCEHAIWKLYRDLKEAVS